MFFIKTWPEEKVTGKQKRIYNLIGRSLAFALTRGHKILINGLENRVKRGSNLIICTHGDEERDVAAITIAYSKKENKSKEGTGRETEADGRRQVFFAANTELYYPDEFRKLVEKNIVRRWGAEGMDYKILGLVSRRRLIEPFIKIVTSNIADMGCIPINIRGGNNSEGVRMIREYLLAQRVVALIQYYSKAQHKLKTPLFQIKPGGLVILDYLYEHHKLDVPITLMTVKKTDSELIANIGKPEFISSYYIPHDIKETVQNAKTSLEDKLEKLYHQH